MVRDYPLPGMWLTGCQIEPDVTANKCQVDSRFYASSHDPARLTGYHGYL